MTERRTSKQAKGPVWWTLALVGAGVILLFVNFLFIEDFNIALLLPLALLLIGVQILLRGDFLPDAGVRTYGIRRGNAEGATLNINAGEIDVSLRALRDANQERLIAGQYASNTLPTMQVGDIHVDLTMNRWQTPWLSFADWEMGLSPYLPWTIGISSFLGQVEADLSRIVLQSAIISTGTGDIQLIAPAEAFDTLEVFSTLGNIHLKTPPGVAAIITLESGRFSRVEVAGQRYDTTDDETYIAKDSRTDAVVINIYIRSRYGNVYLT